MTLPGRGFTPTGPATMWASRDSAKVHILLPGYRSRSTWTKYDKSETRVYDKPLCSASLLITVEPGDSRGYELLGNFDDPITPRGRTFCPLCLGRLIEVRGMTDAAVTLLREAAR